MRNILPDIKRGTEPNVQHWTTILLFFQHEN
jgi:hypothetical protein